ncbi:L-xylulose reductase [Plakobranchus ocellatus]|uniref:L-xylulose reductase n=1 Tax=Plakobranchus ocellatus TaxID=259542 RepID=A0AAV3ZR13_9GAST|nr:L-xylulose reductase [Plakobranchus ocellatus]
MIDDPCLRRGPTTSQQGSDRWDMCHKDSTKWCSVKSPTAPLLAFGLQCSIQAIGIGRDIAKALVKCGAQTAVLSRTQEDLDSLKAECPELETCCVDLNDWSKAQATVESLGHFDLLVNNAGVSRVGPFLEVKEEDIDHVFKTNFKGLFNVSQVVARSMVAKKSGGAIVNLSSAASTQALHDHAVYCSAKGAVDSLTTVMALELGPHKLFILQTWTLEIAPRQGRSSEVLLCSGNLVCK